MRIKREQGMAFLPLVLFGILVLGLAVGLHHAGKNNAAFATHVGDAAPDMDLPLLEVDNAAGGRFANAAWRGRPYIINFFASWCNDCRAEHEELMTLAAGHMPLIGVVFKDAPDKAAAYLDREGNPFVAVVRDDDGRAGIDWGLTGVPETFVIDADGIIRWHYIGGLTDDVVRDELMPVWEDVAHN